MTQHSVWKKLALALFVGLPLALVTVEVTFRGVQWARGRPYSSDRAHTQLLRVQSRMRDFVPRPEVSPGDSPLMAPIVPDNPKAERLLHPYLGYEIVGGIQQVDDTRNYLRGHPDPDRYELLILGGSVAQIFGQYGKKKLLETLRADARFADRDVRLIQFGRGGFKQPQQVNFLVYLLSLGWPIDGVINLDGFNEVALGNNNAQLGTHPVFPSLPHWAHLAVGARTDRAGENMQAEAHALRGKILALSDLTLSYGLYRSSILGEVSLSRLNGWSEDLRVVRDRYTDHLRETNKAIISGPAFDTRGNKPIFASVRSWMESSRTMADICKARSIDYLHVLQPTLHDEGSKPLTPEEIAQGSAPEPWTDGVHRGYPLLRKAGLELAERGVDFVDMSMVFEHHPEELYFDSCHFGQAGNDILGVAIGKALLEHLSLKPKGR